MNADLLKTLFCVNINKRNQTALQKKKSRKSDEHVYQCETRKSPISYHKPCTKLSYYTRNGKLMHFAEEHMHSSSKWGEFCKSPLTAGRGQEGHPGFPSVSHVGDKDFKAYSGRHPRFILCFGPRMKHQMAKI